MRAILHNLFVIHPGSGKGDFFLSTMGWRSSMGSPIPFIALWRSQKGYIKYFQQLLTFWNIPLHKDYLEQAIHYASFDNMRKTWVDNLRTHKLVLFQFRLPIFATGDIQKTNEAFHVRKGEIGGYKDYLSPDDTAFLTQIMVGGYLNGMAIQMIWSGAKEQDNSWFKLLMR